MNHLLVVLPAYNEAQSIGNFLEKLLENPLCVRQHILVVNDGSRDNTAAIAREKGVHLVSHIYNLGYAGALQTAYKYATEHNYEYLIQIDADGQHDVCNIDIIYDVLTREHNPPDIVIGSRFIIPNPDFRVSKLKKFAIRFFRGVIKLFTGNKITDPTSGLQGMNAKTFRFHGGYNNFFNDYPDANMIVQMILNKYKVEEVGAIMHPRLSGVSMHSGLKPIKYIFQVVLSIAVVLLRKIFHR